MNFFTFILALVLFFCLFLFYFMQRYLLVGYGFILLLLNFLGDDVKEKCDFYFIINITLKCFGEKFAVHSHIIYY